MIKNLKYFLLGLLCFAGVSSARGGNVGQWTIDDNNFIIGKDTITETLDIPDSVRYYIEPNFSIETWIVGIGDNAFDYEQKIKTVNFSSNTQQIGNYAFTGCSNLVSVAGLTSSLNSIGVAVFEKCVSLKSIDLSKTSLTSLPDHTFLECKSMTDFSFPEFGLTKIGQATFAHCHGLTSINVPSSVSSIGNRAFFDCVNLNTADLSNTKISTVEYSTFNNCTRLATLVLPQTVTAIDEYAFRDCISLTSINDLDALKSIGDSAFSNTRIESINLPRTISSLGSYVFSSIQNLKTVTIASDASLKVLSDGAFSNCRRLEKVVLNEGLTKIAINAFYNCTSLGTIDIPSTVTQIEDYAFRECSNLKTVFVYAPRNSITIDDSAFPSTTQIIYISDFEYEDVGDGYVITKGPNISGAMTVPGTINGEPVIAIGDAAFQDCDKITSFILRDTIKTIGAYAFSGCSSLTEMTLGEDLDKIAEGAFEGCSNLETITVKGSITSVGAKAFHGCVKLKEFPVIGSNLKTIGASAFEGCASLTELELPRSIETIGVKAFADCTNLKSALIYAIEKGSKAVEIAGDAFPSTCTITFAPIAYLSNGDCTVRITGTISGNNGFTTDIVIPETICGETVVSIDDGAFREQALTSTSLTSLVMPDTIETIGVNVFDHCEALTNVVLSANLQSIPAKTFEHCISLKSITLPENLTAIGDNAFYQCFALEEIEIPGGVTSIGVCAFYNCTALTSVIIYAEEGQIEIGENAFLTDAQNETIIEPSYSSVEGWRYEIKSDGTITITGVNRAVGTVKIPASIDGCTVNWIGSSAFNRKRNITQVVLPDTLTYIESYAFLLCSGLTSLEIPASVKAISTQAFSFCTGITSLTLSEGLTLIGQLAFYNCTALKSLTIPASVERISNNAFQNCTSLESVTFNEGLTTISSKAFWGTALKSVTLPASIESVADDAFPEDCIVNYTTRWITTTANGEVTITGVKYPQENLVVPSTINGAPVVAIDVNALADAHIFTLSIPDVVSVNKIALEVGVRVTHGEWIYDIVDSETIMIYAKADGSSFAIAELPATYDGYTVKVPEVVDPGEPEVPDMPEIEVEDLLGVCYVLEDAPYTWVYELSAVEVEEDVTVTNATAVALLITPPFDGELVIPDTFDGFTTTTIGEEAFSYSCEAVTSVVFPNTLTEIQANAFMNCSNLVEVTLPVGMTPNQVAADAFLPMTKVCYQLSETVTDSATGASATWDYIWSKEDVTLKSYQKGSSTVLVPTTLGGVEVKPLTTRLFPAGTKVQHDPWVYTVLDDGASLKIEKGSGSKDNFTIPETIDCYTVTEIGNMAFSLENPFEADVLISSLSLPDTLEKIYAYAFYNQIALESVAIPSNVTSIATYAFGECSSLAEALIYAKRDAISITSTAFPTTCKVRYMAEETDAATGVTWSYEVNEDNSVTLNEVGSTNTVNSIPVKTDGITTFSSAEDLNVVNTAIAKALKDYPAATAVKIMADASLGTTAEEIKETMELLLDLGLEPSYELVDGVLVLTFKLPTMEITSFNPVQVVDPNDASITNTIGTIGVKIIPAVGGAISSQTNTDAVKGCIHVYGTVALDQEYAKLPDVTFDLTPYLTEGTTGEMTLTVNLGSTYKFFKVSAGEISKAEEIPGS